MQASQSSGSPFSSRMPVAGMRCLRNLAEDGRLRPVVEEMCARMWRFGYLQDDIFCNPYPTVSLAPYGPMVGLRDL